MAAVKALQQWCRSQCDGYRDVSITNMTTSFRDGLAFCALIHRHRPELINFDALKKEDVYENNKLAFQVAEEQLGIPALLDAEDMVAMRVPDRLSILTYVSQYYNYFHGRSPIGGMGGIKRPAEGAVGAVGEPAGKKNQPVTAKVFPPSRPARENSPPPSSNVPRPAGRPGTHTHTPQEPPGVKPPQSGTLSNKCVSCNKHVHLVQRQMVDGKLYHRSCAKLLSPANSGAPLRDLPANTAASRSAPLPSLAKPASMAPPTSAATTITPTPTPAPRLGPTWLQQRPNSSSVSASSVSPYSKPAAVTKPTTSVATPTISVTTPTAAPRTSTTAAKTLQSKLKFLQSETPAARSEDTKPSGGTVEVKKAKGEEVAGGHRVTLVVNVGGGGAKNVAVISDTGGGKKKQEDEKNKAAAVISKKLTEENNNSKPGWMSVALKKTDKPAPVETPKKEPEGVRRKVRLKVDPSLLADLELPAAGDASGSGHSPAAGRGKSPDRGGVKPTGSTAAAADSESPSDWRSRLKPVTKPAASSQSTPKSNGGVKPPALSVAVTPSPPKNFLNGQQETTSGGKEESKTLKTKPDFIPKEDIMKELQDIEDNLNELERRGVVLETKLRSSEEDGEDDSVMDDLMVEWFTLIRNKQVAMRRESELVYIGRTQDLEEQQPSVEQELRQLMEKPDHLKTTRDRRREEELMNKLMEIVNDRNAIVEGLDEDRLREEEEDEELNKMMMNFNVKKDKAKKKSPMAKLFGWGGKKDG